MKKNNLLKLTAFSIVLIAVTACSKDDNDNSKPEAPIKAINDTILNVNYESGEVTSGITGITGTHATASDAVYITTTTSSGKYAVAHKVTLGDTGYFSDGAYRSEADAVSLAKYRYVPGDEHRYEVSILLKDWQQWNNANPAYGDNLFQLKMSDNQLLPLRILTKRNAVVARDYEYQDNLITDYRPYINQWIKFRIEVKWAMDKTGYMKIYVKLPDQSDYNLVLERNNFVTFTGNPAVGNVGYLKWGVYREAGKNADGSVITSDNVLTRIAFHDNIRIIRLPLK